MLFVNSRDLNFFLIGIRKKKQLVFKCFGNNKVKNKWKVKKMWLTLNIERNWRNISSFIFERKFTEYGFDEMWKVVKE